MGFLSDDIRLAVEFLEAWRTGESEMSVLVRSALDGDQDSHRSLRMLAHYARRNQLPPDPELEDYITDWEIRDLFDDEKNAGGRPNNKERDIEIAFKIKSLINEGHTEADGYKILANTVDIVRGKKTRYPIGEGRMKQIWMAHREFVSQYLEAQPKRESEEREHMDQILDLEKRILHPQTVNEALELIEDEAVVALPETRQRLKQLEKETLVVCREMLKIESSADDEGEVANDDSNFAEKITKLYWHGTTCVDDDGNEQEDVSGFYPPLWERHANALEQVVEKKNSKPQAE